MRKIRKWLQTILTGDEEILRQQMRILHYRGDVRDAVDTWRKTMMKKYAFLLFLLILGSGIALMVSAQERHSVHEIARNEYGDGDVSIPLQVEAEYKGTKVSGSANVSIPAKELSEEETEQILDAYSEKLPDLVLPANEEGQRVVEGNLSLPGTDGTYGTEISWSSSEPEVLAEDGKVDVIGMSQNSEQITMTATLSLNGVVREVSMDVLVTDCQALYEDSLKNRIASQWKALSGNSEEAVIRLPSETGDGIRMNWHRKGTMYTAILPLSGVILLLVLYLTRYRTLQSKSARYREAVVAEFPAIPDKMILLLNSGMTAWNALMRIASDYENNDAFRGSVIGKELAEIGRRVRETNSNIIREWKNFASRMESGDMLRFCTILEDNMNKGSELSVKLEAESISLRESRKKDIQKKIRLIDSKMMLPMMLLLFSLVLVTLAPAMMGF